MRVGVIDSILKSYEDEQTWYFYNSHEYHILGMPETETQLFKKFTDYGNKDFYFLIGNTSYLDTISKHLLKECGCKVTLDNKVPFANQWHFINIYWHHHIEVIFPIMLSHYLQAYYDKVNDISEFDQESFIRLFDFHIPIQLKVTHDLIKTQEYKEIIWNYFINQTINEQ